MQHRVPDRLVGRVIDQRYEIVERLARGGMSTVYLAIDTRLDREVAVKVMAEHLSADPDFLDRFIREARSAARLSHPHVVQVHDRGAEDDAVYLVMEYVPGRTLRQVLDERGRLTPRHALAVVDPVIDGLAAAHEAGLIHRDVKPENVLIRHDGRVKVADFGLVRAVTAPSRSTTLLGTVAYIAPEVVLGEPTDARSDLYSVGVLLYELLTGRQPFTGASAVQVAYAHVNSSVPPPSRLVPGLSAELDELVQWCAATDPDNRPVDARALLEELRHIQSALSDDDLDSAGPGAVGADVPAVGSPARPPVHEPDDEPGPEADGTGATGLLGASPALAAAAARDTERTALPVRPGRPPRSVAVDDTVALDDVTVDDTETIGNSTRVIAPVAATTTLPGPPAPSRGAAGSDTDSPAPTTVLPVRHADDQDHGEDDGRHLGEDTGEDTRAVPVVRDATAAHGRLDSGRPAPVRSSGRARSPGRPGRGASATVSLHRGHPRRRGVLLVILALLVALVAGLLAWFFGYGPGVAVAVPDVRTSTVTAAQRSLAQLGLDGTVRRVNDEVAAAGTVIDTDPAAATSVRRFQPVTLYVSAGPRLYAVPGLTGRTAAEARAELAAVRLGVGTVSGTWSETVATGRVISQSPVAGSQRRGGTGVDLVLSRGRQPVAVPDVTGATEQQARQRLTDAGLTVAVAPARVFSSTVPDGAVTAQAPAGGQTPRGSTINLTLSKGPRMVEVPAVVGQQVDRARRQLEQAGFRVQLREVLGGFFGTVRAQDPREGTAPEGSTIVLTVV
ncbi:serine/threonine protein kinase [Tersicoccus solisilvae]|uniref:non-specific serine/threonine protein kinase n=1 Tax=Tersicoccus solisilvae TaxID=1882339 RepID=A0ABQ1PCR2_9MICC|nr:Stk1 family PASTA domain-containing Ser/Thr kinase [Tersicoccus solisilvae]GGC94659.1 serine/threonine protein kinase [Tersicoccus solisilvae]